MLSRCFKDSGFDILAVDHSKNRFLPRARICQVDLTKQHGWDFLNYVIKFHNVVFVHAAPPCGTCSRAREIKPDSVPNLCEVKPSRGAFPTWPQVTRQGLPVQIPSTKDLARSLKLVRLPTFIGPWRTLRGVCCGQSLQLKRLLPKLAFICSRVVHGVGIDLPGKPSFPPCLGFASCKPLALACPSIMCASPMVELDPQVVRCNMQLPRRLLILSRCALRLSALCSKGLTCFPCVWFCRMGP